ncbi:MAG: ABC transporter permease [Planctomycetes bacterium]|nr:ABC transporter permease [Planctomycetota bacterium]
MKTIIILRRELIGYFLSPIAWVVAVVSALFMARFFENSAVFSRSANLSGVYVNTAYWLVSVMMPALTMGSIASEFRNGTIEMLATDPVRDVEIVLGKFFGVVAFFVFCLLPLPVFYVLLRVSGGNPDIGPVLSGFGAMILEGALAAAIGIFASALSGQQIVAFLVSALILFTLRTLGATEGMEIPEWLRRCFAYVSMPSHFYPLLRGRIATNDIIYFLSTTVLFLFLATRVLESRRWK